MGSKNRYGNMSGNTNARNFSMDDFKLVGKNDFLPKNAAQQSAATRTLTISFNPAKLLKISAVVLVLSLVFFAGRLSSDLMSGNSNGATEELSAAATGEVELEETAAEEEVVEETPVEEVVEEEAEETPVEEEAEETPVEEKKEEVIVTTYEDVSITLTSVNTKKGAGETGVWAKISGIGYVIKNNAGGTIKPDHFKMMVEGYGDDFIKEFPIDYKSQSLAPGTYSGSVAVPNGFNVHKNTAGKLDTVRVTVILYDSEGKVIASDSNEFNLNN